MPFKTPYGKHYHETYGCHGATMPCGTAGLSPCSDCCGGAGGKGQSDGGASAGGGSPVAGSGEYRVDDERTNQEAGFDETGNDGSSFGDEEAPSPAETAAAIAEAGVRTMESGAEAPDGITSDDMAEVLRKARPEDGVPYDDWDPETRRIAEKAGIPNSARLLDENDGLLLFETNSVSTANPNDPTDHYGEWLYDTRAMNVVASDGTNLTPTIHVARNLSASMRRATERFDRECLREAKELAYRPIAERRSEEVARARAEAKRKYEEEVVAPWQRGYDAWRAENDDEAQAIAESMRADRPEWRHQYIPGDVEDRMRLQYERRHPRPQAWNHSMDEYQEATKRGEEEAERRLREEGYDEEAETRRHLAEVKARRDPEGRQGVSKAMHTNYDAAMERLNRYPGAAAIAKSDLPMTWGNTLGNPVDFPAPWKRRMDDTRIANDLEQGIGRLDTSVSELRRRNGHTADVLQEVSSHMREVSDQLRGTGDLDRERAVRMLRLDAARLEQDIDYMRRHVDEDGHTADLAADVARQLRDAIERLK